MSSRLVVWIWLVHIDVRLPVHCEQSAYFVFLSTLSLLPIGSYHGVIIHSVCVNGGLILSVLVDSFAKASLGDIWPIGWYLSSLHEAFALVKATAYFAFISLLAGDVIVCAFPSLGLIGWDVIYRLLLIQSGFVAWVFLTNQNLTDLINCLSIGLIYQAECWFKSSVLARKTAE